MDDVLIFANPISGRGRGRVIAEKVAGRLAAEGFRPRLFLERADQIDPDQLDPQARAAIVIGGDGTVRTVAKQLYQHAEQGPPILIIPMGTANLLGAHLGLRWEMRTLSSRVADAVREHRVVHLDTAAANGELFLLMAGIGIDAEVVHELDRIRTGPIALTSYLLPAAMAFTKYTYPPITVRVDGRTILRQEPAIAFVGNVKEYGTGFPLLPHARPDDQLLDVCVMPCRNPFQAARHMMHVVLGEHLQEEGVLYVKGREIFIDGATPVPLQIDGEAAGHTPVEIRLLPVRIPFIVPRGRVASYQL